MRSLLLLPLLLAAGVFASVAAPNTFEGNLIITAGKVGTEGTKTVLAVKNDKMAINPGTGPQMVLNIKSGDFFSVVKQDNQKLNAIMKLNVSALSGLKDMPAFMGPLSNYTGLAKNTAEVSATEEIKTISGYKCRKYIIKDEATTTTVWLTQDIPFSITPLLDLMNLSAGMNTTLKSSFPMEGTIKDNKTGEANFFKVTAEKKVVDDALFTLPPNMPELDLSPTIKQMIETNTPEEIKQMFDQFMPK